MWTYCLCFKHAELSFWVHSRPWHGCALVLWRALHSFYRPSSPCCSCLKPSKVKICGTTTLCATPNCAAVAPSASWGEGKVIQRAEVNPSAENNGKCPLLPASALSMLLFNLWFFFSCFSLYVVSSAKARFPVQARFSTNQHSTTHSVTPVGSHAVGCLEDCTQTRLSRWHGHNPSSCVAKYLRKQTQTSYSESLIRNNIMHHHFQHW